MLTPSNLPRALAACLTMLASGLAWAGAGFHFPNEPGPYAVGLRVVQQYDHSRSFKGRFDIVSGRPVSGERARPLQTLVWYPALPGGQPLKYADYVDLSITEESFDPAGRTSVALARYGRAIRAVAGQSMRATRDGPPAPGRFPLVIYAPSFGAIAAENADLCEYLASHGYVVVASASMGARSRAMTADLEGIEAQVGDIEYLIAYARSLPQVDFEKIAAVGFSWGGLANVAAAARDSRIRALVSLDGTVRYDNEMVKAIGYLAPSKIDAPYLYVASRPATLEQLNIDRKYYDISRNFLNELRYSDVYVASMAAMAHEDFSSFFLRVLPAESSSEGYTRQEASVAHGWVARYVERFLAAYLGGSAEALAFLAGDPERNGVPRHFMRMDLRKPQATAPTLENIGLELDRRGFDHAGDVVRELRLDDAQFKPAEELLLDWARRVLYAGSAVRAVQVCRFALLLYPESADLHDGLGDAWQSAGDKARAEASYRRALALDPRHRSAARHLRELSDN